MPRYRWTFIAISGFLSAAASQAQMEKEPDPLFQSNEVLEVRISAPFDTILKERSDEDDVDATFQYTNAAGETEVVDIGIRTRGISRLKKDVCPFPPLRLDFKRSEVKKSLFHKQDKLKLVTHCKDRSKKYRDTPLREYLAYRLLNELTDLSFRVRLMHITYIDTDGRDADRTRYGFVIEHKDRLAKRLGLDVLELKSTRVDTLHPDYTNLISVFHFMIGNTDFSPIVGPDEVCCHNHVLLGKEGELFNSVPYDFDQAGFVDAPHGSTNPRFKLRNAKQRLYRGRCRNNGQLTPTLGLFESKRDSFMKLVLEQDGLSDDGREEMTEFLEGFYKLVGSPKQVERKLVKKCI